MRNVAKVEEDSTLVIGNFLTGKPATIRVVFYVMVNGESVGVWDTLADAESHAAAFNASADLANEEDGS